MSFEPIESREEMEAEFRMIKKDIVGLCVGWTLTASDQFITADGLHKLAKDEGKRGVEWHIVIGRNGGIERGRPFDMDGEFNTNHNKNMIGVGFVAGFLETANKVTVKSVPTYLSITRHQWNSFDMILKEFLKVYPNHYVISNDLAGGLGPGFDVSQYARKRFRYMKAIPGGIRSSSGIMKPFITPTDTI